MCITHRCHCAQLASAPGCPHSRSWWPRASASPHPLAPWGQWQLRPLCALTGGRGSAPVKQRMERGETPACGHALWLDCDGRLKTVAVQNRERLNASSTWCPLLQLCGANASLRRVMPAQAVTLTIRCISPPHFPTHACRTCGHPPHVICLCISPGPDRSPSSPGPSCWREQGSGTRCCPAAADLYRQPGLQVYCPVLLARGPLQLLAGALCAAHEVVRAAHQHQGACEWINICIGQPRK